MKRSRHQRLATALAAVALLAGAASVLVPAALGSALAAVLGLAALAGALHVVRPPVDPDHTEYASTRANVLGTVTAVAMGVLGLLLVAALVARVGTVRYLGEIPLLLSENFELVTGPLTVLLALGALLAARDGLAVRERATLERHAATAVPLGLAALASLVVALPGTPGQAWHAPYGVGLAALLAWLDAVTLAGLPRPTHVGRWLERGETRHSRLIVEALARAGNAVVVVGALGGLTFLVLGYPAYGLGLVLASTVLLLATTHSAVTLTEAVPAALSKGVAGARRSKNRLRLLAIAPIATGVVAGLLTLAGLAAAMGGGGLGEALALLRPIVAVGVAALAAANLARAGLPSFEPLTPARRAVSTVAVSLIAVSTFFSLLLELGVMTGSITNTQLGIVFGYAALLGAALFVHARGLYPVPGLDAAEGGEDAETRADHGDELQRRVVILYAAAGLFLAASIALVGGLVTGRLQGLIPRSPEGRNAAFLGMVAMGLLIVAGLLVAFLYSRRLDATPEESQIEFERSYTREEVLQFTILGVSGTLAFVLGILGIMVFAGQLDSIGGFELEKRYATDFLVAAILVGIGPAGYLRNRERKRIQAIDERLPEFLRDLAESQRTGMTLTQAVITASNGNYGALTPEIEKMAAQIEWGVSFDDALKSFAERVDTPLVQRTVSLVIEASNAGGNVKDVLEAAAEDAREIQMIESERRSGMQIYVMIIYIAFAVFLGVIGVLNVKFMPEVARAVSGAEGVSVGSITFQEFDIQTFQTLFFHASVIQGLGGGFVAGSMQEGKPVAGLKHAFVMTVIAYVTFRFFLGA